MIKLLSILTLALSFSTVSAREFQDHNATLMDHGDGHMMNMSGAMVMGNNTDILPGGCDSISESREITVHAGHEYAEKFPGRMFAFDQQEYHIKPCTKLTVTLVNDDEIRHQWMMHGLPKYLYPKGMFHLEVTGPGKVTGTLIFPPADKTYLVHCDISQHMEKGMKGQLKVGKGSGDLPSIPGITANVIQDDYSDSIPALPLLSEKAANDEKAAADKKAKTSAVTTVQNDGFFSGVMIIGLAFGLFLAPFLAKKCKGKSASEIMTCAFELIGNALALGIKSVKWLIALVFPNKALPEK